MYCKRFCFVASVVVAFAVLLAATTQPVFGESPEPQLRYFALAVDATDPPPPPNLLAPGSKLLVVHDKVEGGLLTFCHDAPSEFLAGTHWGRVGRTAHITDHGVETYPLWWLKDGPDGDMPPIGAIAKTGPDGEAEFVDCQYVRMATGSECNYSTTKWWVTDDPDVNTVVWYIGMGLFSK